MPYVWVVTRKSHPQKVIIMFYNLGGKGKKLWDPQRNVTLPPFLQ